MSSVFKKVMDGIKDPEKNNPEHAKQVARDKAKEYTALTHPKPLPKRMTRNDTSSANQCK